MRKKKLKIHAPNAKGASACQKEGIIGASLKEVTCKRCLSMAAGAKRDHIAWQYGIAPHRGDDLEDHPYVRRSYR